MITSENKLTYHLAMPDPHTHYFEVSIHYKNFQNTDYQDFKIPVWTPGSYLIREYARHVEGVRALDMAHNFLNCEKINKNTWRVHLPSDCEAISFTYQVYAYDWTVRTAFLDNNQAYINGAAVFMYPQEARDLSAVLHIVPAPHWQHISTSLPRYKEQVWQRFVKNYDILVDAPILISNHRREFFEVANVPHEFAIFGLNHLGNFEQLIQDTQAIIKASVSIFNHHPCSDYLLMAHFGEKGGGGLEHADSTSLQFPEDLFFTEDGYERFLVLVAHEYFHLWNVKRLRPAPLDNFDYDQENYCRLLWVVEGFTSYYQYVILRKAQLLNEEAFAEKILDFIREIEQKPGRRVQSLSESSFDAWIKAYRPNENSPNSQISYYTKGAVIAWMLDTEIITESKGQYNLDDFMKIFYELFYLEENRPYEENDLQEVLGKFLPSDKIDNFFEKYIHGTEMIDYAYYFDLVGVELIQEKTDDLHLGLAMDGNKVKYVTRESDTYWAGINVNDEIIGVNDKKFVDWQPWLTRSQLGDCLQVTLIRQGNLREVEINLMSNKSSSLKLKLPEDKSDSVYQKWQRN